MTAEHSAVGIGVVNGGGGHRNDMVVVHIGGDTDNAVRGSDPRLFVRSSGNILEHRIGPIDMPVDRILTRKHLLRESGADDHDRLVSLVIERVEIAPGNNGNAQRAEKAGRDGTPQRAGIVFAMDVAITRELQAWTEVVGITPRGDHPDSCLADAG